MMETAEYLFSDTGLSLPEKVEASIALLREHEAAALELSSEGYYLAFSGGKDSCVIKHLARRAGVKFTAHYSVTTIDPPELVRFIKAEHPDVRFIYPEHGFFWWVRKNGLPFRQARWCCRIFKECHGDNRWTITGVRRSESQRRRTAWMSVTKFRSGVGYFLCPILTWSEEDVWQYIYDNGIPYSKLYDEGFTRLGCIGCPMAGVQRRKQFIRWPKMETAWRQAAQKYWDSKTEHARFATADEFFNWWLSDHPTPQDECPGLW